MSERIETAGTVRPGMGQAPAVMLVNPKYGHNAAGVLRLCSVFGYGQLWLTGDRWDDGWDKRMPREERMKLYQNVQVYRSERPLDAFGPECTPVAVEILENAEPLAWFQHPDNPVYVFGPEDGSVPKGVLKECHRRIILPTDSCVNLAVAAGIVLADRQLQRQRQGREPVLPSYETTQDQRGFLDSDAPLRRVS